MLKMINKKGIAIYLPFFFIIAVSLILLCSCESTTQNKQDDISKSVDINTSLVYVDDEYISEAVKLQFDYLDYFDKNLSCRFSGTDKEREAAQYLSTELSSFGYSPTVQNFSFEWCDNHYNSQNVIAKKAGYSPKYKIILGAHYDSVQTSGIDDNASGVVLLLSFAKYIASLDIQYDIEIVFFGSEENGLRGSNAYVKAMSAEDIDKTVVMINTDTLLAGTYRYVYSGTEAENGEVFGDWGAYLTRELAKYLGLSIKLNNSEISGTTTPVAIPHSDHASFQKAGIPYIYFESTNWDLPDDEELPGALSTGDYETEIGRFMHNPLRDNLGFILDTFGVRAKENMRTYTMILPNLVWQIMDKADIYIQQ